MVTAVFFLVLGVKISKKAIVEVASGGIILFSMSL